MILSVGEGDRNRRGNDRRDEGLFSYIRLEEGEGDPPHGPIGRNTERNFRGEKRSHATHASVTDPDARLYQKADGPRSGGSRWERIKPMMSPTLSAICGRGM